MAIISSIREYVVKFRTTGTENIKSAGNILTGLDTQMERNAATIGSLDRNLKGAAKATSNTTKEFAKMTQGLGGMVHIYAIVASNIFAATSAFNALRKASALTELQGSMQALSTATGVAAHSIVADLKRISEGALSTQTAMQTIAGTLPAGISGQQLKDLTKIATDASKVMGRDAADSIGRLTRAVIRLQPALIDDIGLVSRVDDATREYAASIGKTAKDLTSFEKRMAFANAVIEEGTTKFSNLSGEMKVNPYDKIAADLENVGRNAAAKMAAAIEPIITGLTNSTVSMLMIGGTILSNFFMRIVPNSLSKTEEKYKEVQDSIAERAKVLQALSSSLVETVEQLPSVSDAKAAADAARAEVEKALKDARDIINRKRKPMEISVGETTFDAKDIVGGAKLSALEMDNILRASEEQVNLLSIQMHSANKKEQEALKKQLEAHGAINTLLKAKIELNKRNTDASQAQADALKEQDSAYRMFAGLQEAEIRKSIRLDSQRKVAQLADVGQFGAALKGIWGVAKTTAGDRVDLVPKESFEGALSGFKRLGERINLTSTLAAGGIQKAMAFVSRFTPITMLLAAAWAGVTAAVEKHRVAIGINTEESKKAKEGIISFENSLKDLEKTHLRYKALLDQGLFSDAVSLRAQTLLTIMEGITTATYEQIAAIKSRNEFVSKGDIWSKLLGDDSAFSRRQRGKENVKGFENEFLPAIEKGLNKISVTAGPEVARNLIDKFVKEADSSLFNINIDDRGIVSLQSNVKNLGNITTEEGERIGRTFIKLFDEFKRGAGNTKSGLESINATFKEMSKDSDGFLTSFFSGSPLSKLYGQLEGLKKSLKEVEEGSEQLGTDAQERMLAVAEEFSRLDVLAKLNIGKPAKELVESITSLRAEYKAATEEFSRLTENSKNTKSIQEVMIDELRAKGIGSIDPSKISQGVAESIIAVTERIAKGEDSSFYSNEARIRSLLASLGVKQNGLTEKILFDYYNEIIQAQKKGNAELVASGERVKKIEKALAVETGKIEGVVGTVSSDVFDMMVKETNEKRALQDIQNAIQVSEAKNTANLSDNVKLARLRTAAAAKELDIIKATDAAKRAKLPSDISSPEREAEIKVLDAELASQLAAVQAKVNLAKQEERYREELAKTELTSENLEKLYAKFPNQWREINSLVEQHNEALKFQEERQLANIEALNDRIKAEEEINEIIRDKFTIREESPVERLGQIKSAQVRAAAAINKEADNAIAEADRRIKSVRAEQGLEGVGIKAEAERAKNLANEDRLIKLRQLDLDTRKELLEQEWELFRNQMKEVPRTWGEAGTKLRQAVWTLGQKFRADIKEAMGFVEGAANVMHSAIDSVSDSLIDAIVQGKDLLKSVGEALRTTLLDSLSDMAKDLFKSNIKKVIVTSLDALGDLLPEAEKLKNLGNILKDPQEKIATNTENSIKAIQNNTTAADANTDRVTTSIGNSITATNRVETILINIDKNIASMANCGCPDANAQPVDLSALDKLQVKALPERAKPEDKAVEDAIASAENSANKNSTGMLSILGKIGSSILSVVGSITGLGSIFKSGTDKTVSATKDQKAPKVTIEDVYTPPDNTASFNAVLSALDKQRATFASGNALVEDNARALEGYFSTIEAELKKGVVSSAAPEIDISGDLAKALSLIDLQGNNGLAKVESALEAASNKTISVEESSSVATRASEQLGVLKDTRTVLAEKQTVTNKILTDMKSLLTDLKGVLGISKGPEAAPVSEASDLITKSVTGATQTNSQRESLEETKPRTPTMDTSVVKMDKGDQKIATDQKSFLDGIFKVIGIGNKESKEGNEEISSILKGIQGGLLTALATGGDPSKTLGSTIMGTIGSAVGSIFGGPVGAQLGGSLGSLLGSKFAKGGVMTSAGEVPLRRYAKGGIANSPQLAMYGEGSKPEAYVPLPDGRAIPVAMEGSSGNNNNVSINVAIDSTGQAQTNVTADSMRQQGARLGVLISNAVQAELVAQQRPGGLLYRR